MSAVIVKAMLILIWRCICIVVVAAAAGRLVYCCGSYSHSAALRTRPFPLRSSSVCSVMDIAWRNRLIAHLNC